MAFRDLTKRFLELRKGHRPLGSLQSNDQGSREQKMTLLGDDALELSDTAAIQNALPPVWMELLDTIDLDVKSIEQQMGLLRSYHSKRLRIVLDDSAAGEQDQQIQETTKSITELFHNCESRLKKIALKGNEEGKTLAYQDRVIRLNVMRSRAMKIQELSTTFRKIQRSFISEVTKQAKKGNKYIDEEILNSNIIDDNIISRGFTPEQMKMLETFERSQQDRTAEILEIAKSVNELALLFNELNVLIVEQGSLLDRIDYNVDQTVNNLTSSKKHLDDAEKYQKRSTTALCVLILCVLVVVCGLILIIKAMP